MTRRTLSSAFFLAAVIGLGTCASQLAFLSIPKSVRLPAQNEASLKANQLGELNAALLGLSTEAPETFPLQGDLFHRPRALLSIEITGLNSLPSSLSGGNSPYSLSAAGASHNSAVDAVRKIISATFGPDELHVDLSTDTKVDRSKLKAKKQPLLGELEEALKLAASVHASKENLNKATAPAVFRVSIENANSEDLSDLVHVINQLTNSFHSVYGESVVIEIASYDSEEKAEPAHVIHKREAGKEDTSRVMELRKKYNVSIFISTDYPAIFAIFAGLAILLSLAILYIVVGLWTMDPGRDSIIYRMTTTRMKKD